LFDGGAQQQDDSLWLVFIPEAVQRTL
jgi:hypothetical protein